MDEQAYQQMQKLQEGHWWWRGMRRLYRVLLRRYAAPGGLTVDVGCGYGANLSVLQETTAPRLLIGVDVEFEALETIPRRPGLALIQARADALPFKAGTFDTVALLAVVEHVEHDDEVLRESHRIAKTGAFQFLLTSAFMLLWSHHDTANQHKRRYHASALDRLQKAAGWRVLHTGYVNAAVFLPVLIVRRLQRGAQSPDDAAYDMGPNPPILRTFFEHFLHLEGLLLLIGVRFPFGVDLISVSRRED